MRGQNSIKLIDGLANSILRTNAVCPVWAAIPIHLGRRPTSAVVNTLTISGLRDLHDKFRQVAYGGDLSRRVRSIIRIEQIFGPMKT
ncbi:hypothetical protein SeMB42_g06840 [Synchytrium endobioticum]|uniref:Uncharacterized protein n=1 Tax=Synchytrium endobioticum TaxID=286115 RepID=A0A507CFB6_9FUNG|nr:hypothetical protein SeMB42_g06840 [Synchytrium endobioticum]